MSAVSVIAYVLSFTVTTLAFVLRHGLALSVYFYDKYPQVASSILVILFVYAIYRYTKMIIRWWIRMVWWVIKASTIMTIIMTIVAILLRGYDRFFNNDLPLLRLLWNTSRAALSSNSAGFSSQKWEMKNPENFNTLVLMLFGMIDPTEPPTTKSVKRSANPTKTNKRKNPMQSKVNQARSKVKSEAKEGAEKGKFDASGYIDYLKRNDLDNSIGAMVKEGVEYLGRQGLNVDGLI